MSFWDSIKSGVSNTGNGLVDFVDKLGNTSIGQAALDLGAAYAQGRIDKETYDKRIAELTDPAEKPASVPKWAVWLGAGSVCLLGLALILQRKD